MWGRILDGYLKQYMDNVPSWMNGMDVEQWMQSVMSMMGSSNSVERSKENRANRVRHGRTNPYYNNAKHRHRGGFNNPGMKNNMTWGSFPWSILSKELPPWIQNMISPRYSGPTHSSQQNRNGQNNFSMPPFGMSFEDMMNQWPFNQMNFWRADGQDKSNSVK